MSIKFHMMRNSSHPILFEKHQGVLYLAPLNEYDIIITVEEVHIVIKLEMNTFESVSTAERNTRFIFQ